MQGKLDLSEDAVWKKRFRAPSIAWATVANLDPTRGLVCTDRDGILQLYAWDVETGDLRRLTDRAAGVVNGTLSSDGRSVYYLRDDGGNEIGHFVRVPFDGGAPEDVTPDLPPYGSFQMAESFSGNLRGARLTDPSGQMLYLFPSGEEPRQIHKSTSHLAGPSLSSDGTIAVIATTEGTGSPDTRLVAFDVESGTVLSELWDGEGVGHVLGLFSSLSGDARMLSSTSASGTPRPIVWNPRTSERRDLAVDEIAGEVHAVAWSRDGRRVLLSQRHRGLQRLYLYDLERDDGILALDHPDGMFGVAPGAFAGDGRILVTWQDAAHPARLIALDAETGANLGTVLAAGEVPEGRLWESIAFVGANGDEIQGWLAVPEGDGPFPTILHTHGGPTAAMLSRFSPECQAWLDHGFAFLTINYHGSTTFGKAFEKSIVGRLGELEVEDMAAAHGWLVDRGIARPDKVFVMGGSYGGYLTLLAVGVRPELWAGGMADVAIADWAVMYEDESEALRGYQRVLFGGTPEEAPDAHAKSSPITYADRIEAPLLVIQGRNDTRCPARQMETYEETLKRLGKEISVHWFDAGHGSRAQQQRIDHQERRLRFAHEILRKRIQL